MNALVMYDHQTDSLWSHFTGDAVAGPMVGTRLEVLPAIQTTWGRWRELYPDSLVLDKRGRYRYDSYDSYYSNSSAGVIGETRTDDRLPRKETVLGVWVNETAKAYGFSDLAAQPVANDTVGGTDIVVTFDPETSTVGGAFNRRLGDRSLTFQPDASDPLLMVDTETGSSWAVLTGEAVRGALVGSRLEQVESNYAFWFAWKDWHPSTQVFRKGETGS